MNFVAMMKGIHWAAVGQAVGAAIFVALAQQPSLAPVSGLLNLAASALGSGSLVTALAAHKVGSPNAGGGS